MSNIIHTRSPRGKRTTEEQRLYRIADEYRKTAKFVPCPKTREKWLMIANVCDYKAKHGYI